MIKKEIYPKTQRVKCVGDNIEITEKLDGSNLIIFKLKDKIYIAQRNNIFCIDEIEDVKEKLYKGLYQWLLNNKAKLQNELIENAAICGEWLGMGKIKYCIEQFDKKFYMFAKANIYDDMILNNLKYEHNLFIYPFYSQIIPDFIGIVPLVDKISYLPDKRSLDLIYERYVKKVKRNVEGFVLNYENNISKYVRMKNGKLQEHFDRS